MADFLRRLERRGITDTTAVSFSVDPAHDDPATLRTYAKRFAADDEGLTALEHDLTTIR